MEEKLGHVFGWCTDPSTKQGSSVAVGHQGMLQWDTSLLTCPECDDVFTWSGGSLQNGKAFLLWLYSHYTWCPGCVHVRCKHLCTEHLWTVPVVLLLLCYRSKGLKYCEQGKNSTWCWYLGVSCWNSQKCRTCGFTYYL